MLLIHNFFNGNLPQSFENFFTIEKQQQLEQSQMRPTHPPVKYNDYVLTESDSQPQFYENTYRYRNIPIPGQLQVPVYKTVKYGRNSLKLSSILFWNYF